MRWRFSMTVAVCALLSACAVGPDFHQPPPPVQTAYTAQAPGAMAAPDGVAGGTQIFSDRPADAQWWHQFNAPELDRLIERALAKNSDLAATQAGLRQARELWLAQRGALLPWVSAGAGANRVKGSQYLSPVPNDATFNYSLQTAQVDVGYTLDLFGGNRRASQQARALYDAQAYQGEAARITLINTLASAVFQQAALMDQVRDQQEIIAIQQEWLSIIRHQLTMGDVGGGDVMAQEAQVAQAQAGLQPMLRAMAQGYDLIAYLTGQSAADAALPVPALNRVGLPLALPLTLPSQLVRSRPDIKAAQANLHAASAGVGVAIANRLPQITIGASAGGNAGGWSNILSAANSVWAVGAGITQPIFAGSALLHHQRAARAAYDQADAQYRSTVLGAFRDVADTLAALQTDAAALSAAQAARDKTQAMVDVARRQQDAGAVPPSAVLQARIARLQAEQALSQAQAARLSDTAALFQALGGGL